MKRSNENDYLYEDPVSIQPERFVLFSYGTQCTDSPKLDEPMIQVFDVAHTVDEAREKYNDLSERVSYQVHIAPMGVFFPICINPNQDDPYSEITLEKLNIISKIYLENIEQSRKEFEETKLRKMQGNDEELQYRETTNQVNVNEEYEKYKMMKEHNIIKEKTLTQKKVVASDYRYVFMSILYDNTINENIIGVKFRAFTDNQKEFDTIHNKLYTIDRNFNIMVGDMFCWLGLLLEPETQMYSDPTLNAIMNFDEKEQEAESYLLERPAESHASSSYSQLEELIDTK
jgi:hypothetical protein